MNGGVKNNKMTESNEKKYTVYKITCLANGRVYVGVTGKTAEGRFKEHWGNRCRPKAEHLPIYQDMSAFGRDAFIVETIETNLSQEEAALQEKYWIDKFSDDGYLVYNQAAGGGSIRLTEEQERKIVQLYEEGLDMVEIAMLVKRDRRTVSRALNRNGTETRYEPQSKVVLCIGTGAIYSSVCDAARQLELDRASISGCCNGKNNSIGGFHFCFLKDKDTFVIRESKIDPTPKKVLCVETGIIYPSAAEAARQLGLFDTNISACCRGTSKSTGGMHFCFEKDKDTFVIQEPKKPEINSMPKGVLCVEIDVIYPSASEAARQLGLPVSSVSACCRGQRKSTHGLHFRYIETDSIINKKEGN